MYENFVGTWETVRNREVSAWRRSTVLLCCRGPILCPVFRAVRQFAKGTLSNDDGDAKDDA